MNKSHIIVGISIGLSFLGCGATAPEPVQNTQEKVVKYIEADADDSVIEDGYTWNSDLFQEGDIFGDTVYPNYQWYDDTAINFDITIIDVSETEATILIEFE